MSDPSVAETLSRQLPEVVDTTTSDMSHAQLSPSELSSDDEQGGDGIGLLGEAMDLAERGDHEGAWDSLHSARQAKVSRPLMKKAEAYCSRLRDNDDVEDIHHG